MASKESGPSKPIFSRPPYQLTPEEVAQELETSVDTGLSPAQASQALSKFGSNELDGGEGIPIWKVFVKQISNAMYVPYVHVSHAVDILTVARILYVFGPLQTIQIEILSILNTVIQGSYTSNGFILWSSGLD